MCCRMLHGLVNAAVLLPLVFFSLPRLFYLGVLGSGPANLPLLKKS